jgi:GNAT superfamily N-acetyltransferase
MAPEPIVLIEHWEPRHARWSELTDVMKAEDQDHYWSRAHYWARFDHTCIVALHNGDIAGFLEFYLQPIGPDRQCPVLEFTGGLLSEAKILAFAVLEPYRRRGIGRRLQTAAVQRARELDCFQLRSYNSNEPDHRANYALKLSMGFAAQPESRDDGKSGVNFIMPLRSSGNT